MAPKVVPKVSPARGMAVDAWVSARCSGWPATAVRRLLRLARAAAPGATVSIRWSQPVIEKNAPVAFIKVAKAHVTFGFWRGAELADPEQALEGGARMKHLKIRSLDAIDERRLRVLVREAVALNVSK